ncbi:phosphoglycerate kinase [Mesomycoplasma lagogenitalium]|uniref:Phosphoglycerate kinase n=1 Tax=Mesomycoplasma lagogenitalium TaxID=171286 RepID=A0ABY8LWC7_9BACT|nr:phosphoglycerate kinase [Mesomycoplasma lagogenitalium]WGI36551.1 phosphoglycerate kinase [Mesomycoplasma lagogenitalium]
MHLTSKKTIDDLQLKGKKVLIRVDFNVPIKDGKITSVKRIVSSLPTINKVLEEGGKAIVFSHLGRVKEEADKTKKSLKPVVYELANQLGRNIIYVDQTRGAKLEHAIEKMQDGEILVFENTRFEDLNNKAESKNDPELGKYWASLGDVFINDAFGTAHRAHASNVGIASNIAESAMGYLLEKEVKALSKIVHNPIKPFVAIIGGAKISDKIGVVSSLLEKADKVIIGGGMAYTFNKALGFNIGNSLVEEDKIELAKEYLEKYKDKIILPVDHASATSFEDQERILNPSHPLQIPENTMGLDIDQYSIELFKSELEGAKTVLWNGPMGVTEFSNFKYGTEAVAKEISKLEDAYSVIGGGDSVAAVENLGFEDAFSHISTGGGASIEFLEGKELPGIKAIQDK